MDVSCLIPTCERPDKLVRCVASLVDQQAEGVRFEVLVGVDGPDRGEADAVATAVAANSEAGVPVRVFVCERAGPAATRNTLTARARGAVLLFLNDDVIARPGLIAEHARAQAEQRQRGTPAMVLGAAPFVVPPDDSLFDRLIRETSMVFFYDRMTGPPADDPDHDWGFRHAWTLNLSVPASCVRETGGFSSEFPSPCFEDLQFAFRLQTEQQLPVLYRPAAVVEHDHRYSPMGYLCREQFLGEHAVHLARVSPACALAIFRRDITDPAFIEYCARFIELERPDAQRLEATFTQLASAPASAIPSGETGSMLIQTIYQQHLMLKRWWFRRGLVHAATSERSPPAPQAAPA